MCETIKCQSLLRNCRIILNFILHTQVGGGNMDYAVFKKYTRKTAEKTIQKHSSTSPSEIDFESKPRVVSDIWKNKKQ